MSKPGLPQTAPGGPKTAGGGGVEDRTRGSGTIDRDYVQSRHFIYVSPSSASAEGEYGILEPKFPDGGQCQCFWRRQWVVLLPASM